MQHVGRRNTRPGQGPRCCHVTAAQWEPKNVWITVIIYMSLLVLLVLFRIELQTTHT